MTELTDKMRTCAAYIRARPNDAPMPTEHLLDDAATLLETAAEAIDAHAPAAAAPEPWPLLEPLPPKPFSHTDAMALAAAEHSGIVDPGPPPAKLRGTWMTGADTLPTTPHPQAGARHRHPRVCPKCDSHATKRVVRNSDGVYLICPACVHEWKYQP